MRGSRDEALIRLRSGSAFSASTTRRTYPAANSARHPGIVPGSIAEPLMRRQNGSRLKAGMTIEK